MRNFVILLFVLGLIGVGVKTMGHRGGAAAPAASELYDGYWEMRMGIKVAQRDIDFVVVGEKPTKAECESGASKIEIPALCKGQLQCTVKQVECNATVAPRYVNMLQKKPVSLHYLHFSYAQTDPPRAAVMVAWGLTADESMLICQAMAKDPKIQRSSPECI